MLFCEMFLLCSCQTNTDTEALIPSFAKCDGLSAGSSATIGVNSQSARRIVEQIKKNVNCQWSEETVDTFKAGDPDTLITGITTTGFATMDVLKKAATSGNNLIITHEPTFYNHYDKFDRLKGDYVQESKLAFIKKHKLVVWRFHDHWHRHQPDGIYVGMIETLGLDESYIPGEKKAAFEKTEAVFDIPETTARKLALELKEQLKAGVVRGVGNPNQKVTRVALVLGSPSSMKHFGMLQRDDIDLVIGGESPEWETTEYVRDAVSLGKRKGLILLGHNNSEEGGMRYCKEWLQTFIDEMPIEFVPAGDPFWSP